MIIWEFHPMNPKHTLFLALPCLPAIIVTHSPQKKIKQKITNKQITQQIQFMLPIYPLDHGQTPQGPVS